MLYRSDVVLAAGVVGLVVLSMVLVGAVHVRVILALTLLALPLGAAVFLRLRAEGLLRPSNPIWVFVGLAFFTMLQATPLPHAVFARLAPKLYEVWDTSLRPFGAPAPAWHSLSIDTGATWVEACKWLTYAAVFGASSILAWRGRAVIALATLFGAALLAALISAAHLAIDATRLYGIYEPVFAASPWRVAPLLNPNNLSGYLLLGAFAGAALVLMRRSVLPRAPVLVAMAGVLAVLILTGSRGGVVALAVGLGLFVLFLALPRRPSLVVGFEAGGRWKLVVGAVAVAVVGVGFASLAASDGTWAALRDESFSKLSVVRWTRGLIADNWLLGLGRGAFETAFPPYRAGFGRMIFQYPENFIVQWLSEWGVIVSVLAFGALVRSARPWRLRELGRSDGALAIGMAALLLQNLVDLGLEVMSVGIAFSVALGTLIGRSWRADADAKSKMAVSEEPLRLARHNWPAYAFGLLGLLATTMAWTRGRYTAVEDREALRVAYEALPNERAVLDPFYRELRAAILRHPGDAYLPLLGALAANRGGRDPIPWINRSLERDPERGAAHFLLSQILLGHGSTGQAMLALRYAVVRQPEFLGRAAALVVDKVSRAEDVWAAVPEGPAGVPMLLALALVTERAAGKGSLPARAFVDEASRRDPQSTPARLAQVRLLLRDLQTPDSPCASDRPKCLAELDVALRVLERAEPTLEVVLAGGERRALEGKPAEASRFLAEQCPLLAAPAKCLRERVRYALAGNDARGAADAITAYLAAACDSPAECSSASTWLGDLMEERGDWVSAVEHYSRAVKERPSRNTWRKLANAARAAGQLQRAHEAEQRSSRALDDVER